MGRRKDPSTYRIGRPCKVCGSQIKYIKNGGCVPCNQLRSKLRQ